MLGTQDVLGLTIWGTENMRSKAKSMGMTNDLLAQYNSVIENMNGMVIQRDSSTGYSVLISTQVTTTANKTCGFWVRF